MQRRVILKKVSPEKYQYDYFKISEQRELWQLGKLLLAAVCQRHRSEASNWIERQMHNLQSRPCKCTECLGQEQSQISYFYEPTVPRFL